MYIITCYATIQCAVNVNNVLTFKPQDLVGLCYNTYCVITGVELPTSPLVCTLVKIRAD